MNTKTWFLLVLLCGGALFIRFVFFNVFLRNNPVRLAFDSAHYHDVATQLAEGKGYTSTDGMAYFYRLPGYPFFLAVLYKIFGNNPLYALYAQMVLGSLLPLLVYAVSLTFFPGSYAIALGTALYAAVHPGFLILSGLVMSDTLFMMLFLLFVILLTCAGKRAWMMLLSGIMLGIASLVRPVSIGLFLLACCYLWYIVPTWRQKARSIIFFAFGWLSVIACWRMRNFLITGVWFLHTFSGPHVLNHGAVRVVMYAQHKTYQQAQASVYADYKIALHEREIGNRVPLQEIDRSRCALDVARTLFLSYPLQTLRLCITNIFKTCFSLYAAELLFIDSGGQLPNYDHHRGLIQMILRFIRPELNNDCIRYIIFIEIFLALVVWIGLLGIVYRIVCRKYETGPFMMPVMLIIFFLSISCLCGFARLRLPIEAFLFMLSLMFWIPEQHGKRVERG